MLLNVPTMEGRFYCFIVNPSEQNSLGSINSRLVTREWLERLMIDMSCGLHQHWKKVNMVICIYFFNARVVLF